MTWSSFLVYVEPTAAGVARLETACELATSFNAHLIGVSASLLPPPMVDELAVGAELLATYRKGADEEVARARDVFEAAVRGRPIKSEWRGGVDWPADLVVRAARAADLVILGPKSESAPYRSPDPASVLQEIGRPVLLIPDAPARSPVGSPAVVGWKDTREAQRAVAFSLPLLRRSTAVSVTEVASQGGQDVETGVSDVRNFLGRHDVEAHSQVLIKGEQTTSSHLLSHARFLNAGLLVIGGYGRPRLQQWVLGGVTRTMLQHSPISVLLTR